MNSIPSPVSLVPAADFSDPDKGRKDRVPNQDPTRRAEDRKRRSAARLLGVGALAILSVMVGLGVWGKTRRDADAAATLQARLDAVPSVRTMIAKADDAPRTIELTGNLAAFDSTTLFARATGYIGVRNVDIGSKVHKGDVLAVIAAPDLDQQLVQAKAQLVQFEAAAKQAEANADLGHVTNQRTARLVAQGWNSLQQGDQDRLSAESLVAALAVANANVVAQQAAVGRIEQLTGFERIVAPFDGVVTSRLTDVGSLVTADSSSGTPLFSLARTDVLRVQVFVPQALSFGIEDGDSATVTVSELPGRIFHGKIARNAQALSAGTRTLLIEVDVDNIDGALAAGLYSVIHLAVRRPNPVITVPSQAVMFNQDGLKAAVFSDGKVELRKIELELDNGATVDIRAGLKAGDDVILNPPANITDGERVRQG
jgi:RND family efflux transporter MFP subunit